MRTSEIPTVFRMRSNSSHLREFQSFDTEIIFNSLGICHSPLPDWIVDVDGLGSDEDTAVQRNFRKGILATDLNFHTNVRINCD